MYTSNYYYKREKTTFLLLIFDDTSIELELWKKMNLKVNFCDTAKLLKINYVYYKKIATKKALKKM